MAHDAPRPSDPTDRTFASGAATKAQVLEYLRGRVKSAEILPAVIVASGSWNSDRSTTIESVAARFASDTALIVRSSRLDEGVGLNSDSGMFMSVSNVRGEQELIRAVEAVLDSYGRFDPKDEVLIQPMAAGLTGSGVATNCDRAAAQPYKVIELCAGDDSAAVTAGRMSVRSFSLLGEADDPALGDVQPVVALLEELETIFPDSALEIEFGVTDSGLLLFQCRWSPVEHRRAAREALVRRTTQAARQVEKILSDSAASFGATALGVMPDWNPAEMIGRKPTPLAYDLYAHLITNRTWAVARRDLGYHEAPGPLMVKALGVPFIDVGASLASLTPADVPPDARMRVVSACIDQLGRAPHWHDKIEFELLPTCHRPGGINQHWLTAALTRLECASYNRSLRELTNGLARPGGAFDSDAARIDQLHSCFEDMRSDSAKEKYSFSDLLARAHDVAAPLFARVARAAFVATDLARCASKRTGLDVSALTGPVKTVLDDMIGDYRSGDFAAFIVRYGHVRPGTYDVRVPTYEEAPGEYFGTWPPPAPPAPAACSRQSRGETAIDSALARVFHESEFDISPRDFVRFTRRAIAARERAKYLYGGFLSEALTRLIRSAERKEIARELLTFATLGEATALAAESAPTRGFRARIEARVAEWTDECPLRAPSLLFSPNELFAFEDLKSAPNFVTRSRILAAVALLEFRSRPDCRGRIVATEQADPGFDWIFTHGVAGLITAYGGLNSHMAVRCREMNLPAAIGVGPTLFAKIRDARMVAIDCASQRLEICR